MKPILFNTPMTRAILDGRKTETRRIIKAPVLSQVDEEPRRVEWYDSIQGRVVRFAWNGKAVGGFEIKPPYITGDILYVRETWFHFNGQYVYRATAAQPELWDGTGMWHPSIHMPKEAARLFLQVTDVRVERLQDITTNALQSEGIVPEGYLSQYAVMTEADKWFDDFREVWDSTIKPADRERYGWAANPWVWVISFERCDKPETET